MGGWSIKWSKTGSGNELNAPVASDRKEDLKAGQYATFEIVRAPEKKTYKNVTLSFYELDESGEEGSGGSDDLLAFYNGTVEYANKKWTFKNEGPIPFTGRNAMRGTPPIFRWSIAGTKTFYDIPLDVKKIKEAREDDVLEIGFDLVDENGTAVYPPKGAAYLWVPVRLPSNDEEKRLDDQFPEVLSGYMQGRELWENTVADARRQAINDFARGDSQKPIPKPEQVKSFGFMEFALGVFEVAEVVIPVVGIAGKSLEKVHHFLEKAEKSKAFKIVHAATVVTHFVGETRERIHEWMESEEEEREFESIAEFGTEFNEIVADWKNEKADERKKLTDEYKKQWKAIEGDLEQKQDVIAFLREATEKLNQHKEPEPKGLVCKLVRTFLNQTGGGILTWEILAPLMEANVAAFIKEEIERDFVSHSHVVAMPEEVANHIQNLLMRHGFKNKGHFYFPEKDKKKWMDEGGEKLKRFRHTAANAGHAPWHHYWRRDLNRIIFGAKKHFVHYMTKADWEGTAGGGVELDYQVNDPYSDEDPDGIARLPLMQRGASFQIHLFPV